MPVGVLAALAMVILPLPPIALDVLFTFNIALSLIVVMAVFYVSRPLDFGVFPTVLLLATLLRLALNVASTRVVLLHGHTGGHAAGRVIESFGEFVIGGNYAVGVIVFAILTIINFIVVTKGAGRISEVTARFTLDAMPGKQMAIDADLNAGLITQEEARTRRGEVRAEADFYGSMDGASKFVRGDATAGILILVINMLGGLMIGMMAHDMSFGDSARVYTLLAIGDGLVAQIPALLLSTAVAIIVTRMSRAQDMGGELAKQLLGQPRALAIAAAVLGVMGLIPGMPNLPFLLMGALCGGGAWLLYKRATEPPSVVQEEAPAPTPAPESRELTWEDVQPVDIIGLEVGYRLVPLVDKAQGGDLLARIRGVRRKLTQDLGFLVQAVHIRDNLDLSPNSYRINLAGVPVGEGVIYPERELAINPGKVFGKVSGVETRDPAFGMEAVWIEPSARDHAQTLGYTVVDASTVIATHLSHVIQTHAHELLGHEEVQQLLNALAKSAPKLVEDLTPRLLPLGTVVRTLQGSARRARADSQHALDRGDARGTRRPHAGPAAVAVARARRARPPDRAGHRRHVERVAGDHARARSRTAPQQFAWRRQRRDAGTRTRPRRAYAAPPRRSRAATGNDRRAGGAAGAAAIAPDARALHALGRPRHARAGVERDSGQPEGEIGDGGGAMSSGRGRRGDWRLAIGQRDGR